MTRNVRPDQSGSGLWQDADTGIVLPKSWSIARLPIGGTYTDGKGITWTVREVAFDQRHGGVAVRATSKAPGKVAR